MNQVRLGIVGVGAMGGSHAKNILEKKINRCVLGAVCDIDPARLKEFPAVPQFSTHQKMLRSGKVDAVLIATPHYSHVTVGLAAFKAGRHVLSEKPLGVHKADCEKFIAGHTDKKLVFAEMFNQRTNPYYIKIREMVRGGELGAIRRINWIITNWFRSEVYYTSSAWRATWVGEGGGVLVNQCPHNLDLFQWIFGMPRRVRATCRLGHYHAIEVEDDVTAYMEYDTGTTAVFITSTGEAPGTNRLEIVGENGKLVYENNALTFIRNAIPTTEYSRTTEKIFGQPDTTIVPISLGDDQGGQHNAVLQNFIDAILDGTPLIAQAAEGLNSVELGNAMLYSSLKNKTVELPLDSAAYKRTLKQLINNSKFTKKEVRTGTTSAEDMNKGFNK